jgi:hypothetical protein
MPPPRTHRIACFLSLLRVWQWQQASEQTSHKPTARSLGRVRFGG